MAILSCPVCKWPDGPGCEMCEQGGPLDAATSGCAYAGDLQLSATGLLKNRPDINWHPIAELPEELKDGRPVWYWSCHAKRDFRAQWSAEDRGWYCTESGGRILSLNLDHFCEVNSPEES